MALLTQKLPPETRQQLKELFFNIPRRLKSNWTLPDQKLFSDFQGLLKQRYFNAQDSSAPETIPGFLEHLSYRLHEDRVQIIPWLDSFNPLKGSLILEVGCGTGSSTVALAEQGANIYGIDIDDASLDVARSRLDSHRLKASLQNLNSIEIGNSFTNHKFDNIIFFASIEHMLYEERIESLRQARGILNKGGYITIVETPNRLWYFDGHTAKMPFFHWLDDRTAYDYSRYSERAGFCELYRDFSSEESRTSFLRRGRGFSYHDLDIAFGKNNYKVASSLSSFQSWRYSSRVSSLDRKFKSMLTQINPYMNHAFADKFLYLSICFH